MELFRHHKRSLFLGTFVALATFVLFYIGSAYLLSYNVKVLNIPFLDALEIQIVGSILFGIFIPIAGKLAERFGRREVLIATTVLIGIFSFFLNVLMTSGEGAIFVFAIIAMALMGMTYGLIGTALAAPFPTNVRYTGSSITFNLAGIFRSLACTICSDLAAGELRHGLCRLLSRRRRRHHADLHPALGQGRSLSFCKASKHKKPLRIAPQRLFLYSKLSLILELFARVRMAVTSVAPFANPYRTQDRGAYRHGKQVEIKGRCKRHGCSFPKIRFDALVCHKNTLLLILREKSVIRHAVSSPRNSLTS